MSWPTSSVMLVIVGDNEVGKTRLLASYTMKTSLTDYIPNVLFDNWGHHVTVGGVSYCLVLREAIGHPSPDYDRLRPLLYLGASVFVVCFDVTSPKSFEDVKERWFPDVQHHCPGVPCILVGTKIDLRDDEKVVETLAEGGLRPITNRQGATLALELNAVKYMECSALTRKGVEDVFDEAIMATAKPSKLGEPWINRRKGCIIA